MCNGTHSKSKNTCTKVILSQNNFAENMLGMSDLFFVRKFQISVFDLYCMEYLGSGCITSRFNMYIHVYVRTVKSDE